MKARMDAVISEMAAMNATIRSLAVGANSVPNGQGRNWQAVNAPNAKPKAGESQFRERIICFQCGLEGHYRKDCQANRHGNERGRRQERRGAGQFQ